jgi:hypothetical protein
VGGAGAFIPLRFIMSSYSCSVNLTVSSLKVKYGNQNSVPAPSLFPSR